MAILRKRVGLLIALVGLASTLALPATTEK
jgi:hypothetical protein